MLKALNNEEIYSLLSGSLGIFLGVEHVINKVATAQHQADLKAFIELLESHKFHDDFGGESAKIYRDSLVESLKQMVE